MVPAVMLAAAVVLDERKLLLVESIGEGPCASRWYQHSPVTEKMADPYVSPQ
jgi:hypothetical protein